MVRQLVYSSVETVEFDEESLLELLGLARTKNSKLGVTGMLLYAEGTFLQVLEGEEDVVEALFAKIERDPRHTDTRLLLRTDVEEPSFGDWSMGFHYSRSRASLPEGVSSFLQRGYRQEDSGSAALHALCAFRDGRWRRSG